MKKFVAALLACMMLFSVCAFAEEGPVNEPGAAIGIDQIVNFSLSVDAVPEGYQFEQQEVEGVVYYSLLPAAEDKVVSYMGSVVYCEEFAGYTLRVADLNDDQKAQMEERLSEDMFKPTFTYAQTTHGTDLLVMNENDVESDIVEIVTIYEGYVITLSIFDVDNQIDQGSVDRAIQFLSDMWIVDAK